jgi:hypothetical protein
VAETCGDCGSAVTAGDAFCGQCGKPVNGAAANAAHQDGPLMPPPPRADSERLTQARPSWPAAPAMGQAAPRTSAGAAQARVLPAPDYGATETESVAYDAASQVQVTEIEMVGRGNFDPLHNRWLSQQIFRQAVIFIGLYALAVLVSSIFFLLIGLSGGVSAATSAVTDWVRFCTLLSIAMAVLFWLMPVPALLSQRSKLIGNEADAAELVFRHVAAAFGRHQTPLDVLREKTLHPPGEGRRDYLELRRGHFTGYISCFAHGRDLYVGWTYWIKMSPLRWMLMRVGRRLQELSGRGSDIYQTLRFESARATVAALQSAVLEGTASATAELKRQSAGFTGPVNVSGLDID